MLRTDLMTLIGSNFHDNPFDEGVDYMLGFILDGPSDPFLPRSIPSSKRSDSYSPPSHRPIYLTSRTGNQVLRETILIIHIEAGPTKIFASPNRHFYLTSCVGIQTLYK